MIAVYNNVYNDSLSHLSTSNIIGSNCDFLGGGIPKLLLCVALLGRHMVVDGPFDVHREAC